MKTLTNKNLQTCFLLGSEASTSVQLVTQSRDPAESLAWNQTSTSCSGWYLRALLSLAPSQWRHPSSIRLPAPPRSSHDGAHSHPSLRSVLWVMFIYTLVCKGLGVNTTGTGTGNLFTHRSHALLNSLCRSFRAMLCVSVLSVNASDKWNVTFEFCMGKKGYMLKWPESQNVVIVMRLKLRTAASPETQVADVSADGHSGWWVMHFSYTTAQRLLSQQH